MLNCLICGSKRNSERSLSAHIKRSQWTMDKQLDLNISKQKGTIDCGFDHVFMVIDINGDLICQ